MEQIRQRCAAVNVVTIRIVLLALGVFGHGFLAQTNLSVSRTELNDLEIDIVADRKSGIDPMTIGVINLGHVAQTFDPLVQLDEYSKGRKPHDLSPDRVADMMVGEEQFPDVGLQLLETER